MYDVLFMFHFVIIEFMYLFWGINKHIVLVLESIACLDLDTVARQEQQGAKQPKHVTALNNSYFSATLLRQI